MLDVFIIEGPRGNAIRRDIESVALHWWKSIIKDDPDYLNFRFIEMNEDEDPLDFAIRARQYAFTCSGSDVFILTDNDMLPFSMEDIKAGVDVITEYESFFQLSAMPKPHTIKLIRLDRYRQINNDHIMEHYSSGGLRFCHKVPELQAPLEKVKGYDGVFCRHLYDKHGMKCGYLKGSNAFHLGAHCSTLWDKTKN